MLEIALSPCPNDTFLFFPWILGYVGKSLPIKSHFYDIEELNQHALLHTYPLTKLSLAAYAKVRNNYDLLSIGCALGHKQGPKLISHSPYSLAEVKNLRVAIPGKETTAHLLLSHFIPEIKEKRFCLYHEVLELLKKREVDCGIIIHETRFTFANENFYEIADLGKLFYEKTKSPLPLGALALRKDFLSQQEKISAILRESLAFAKEYPEKGKDFIIEKSQEKDPAIIKKHISLYVNSETENLSEEGKKAIELLYQL